MAARSSGANFRTQVDFHVRKGRARMLSILKESTQRVVDQAQTPAGEGGKMPIDTGFLRASVAIVINGSFPEAKYNPGGRQFTYNDAEVALSLNGVKLGDVINVVWTANYANLMEARYGFARSAAQNWVSIVNAVVREAKARFP